MTGSGTVGDPYIISDADDLQTMADNLTAYYELAGDIDASATSGWNAGAGFAPIDDFEGFLDGKEYKITDLFINRSGSNVGLFDLIKSTAEVSNLGLEDCNITGQSGGALATRNDGAVTDCYSTGSVTTVTNVGGLVALNYGTIEECYSTCTVVSENYAGGLVSYNPGTISKSYAMGSVTATVLDAGGLVMRNAGTISNCYARGAVTAAYDAGGLVEDNTGSIDKCYSTGLVTGGDTIGGLVEKIATPGTVTNSFWDTETSGTETSDGGTGKTTAQMKTKATFTAADWDFTIIWYIHGSVNNGYPALGVVVYPSDDMARISSIRHIFRPGFFRMQTGLGDLGFDIDVAETAVRRELDTAKGPPLPTRWPPAPGEEPGPITCPTCGETVPYFEFATHLRTAHPSLKFPTYEAQIEYEEWFQKQMEELREMGWEG